MIDENLVDAKGYGKGIKRAFTQGENGQIKEHATLEAANKGVNATAAVMGLASMVVGQYYMSQVDTQLKAIKDSLSSISEFLDIQYQSKVASLMEAVYTISKFQISSIENEELRNRELNSIQQLRIKFTTAKFSYQLLACDDNRAFSEGIIFNLKCRYSGRDSSSSIISPWLW